MMNEVFFNEGGLRFTSVIIQFPSSCVCPFFHSYFFYLKNGEIYCRSGQPTSCNPPFVKSLCRTSIKKKKKKRKIIQQQVPVCSKASFLIKKIIQSNNYMLRNQLCDFFFILQKILLQTGNCWCNRQYKNKKIKKNISWGCVAGM